MDIVRKKTSLFFSHKSLWVLTLLLLMINSHLSGLSMSPEKLQEKRLKLAESAKSYIGCPYRYGAVGPNSFDCPGFVSFVVKEVFNIKLPHSSSDIYEVCTKIKKEDLDIGDLVFFQASAKSGITHIGIYIGNNEFVSALSIGSNIGVKISDMNSEYWRARFYAVGRLP